MNWIALFYIGLVAVAYGILIMWAILTKKALDVDNLSIAFKDLEHILYEARESIVQNEYLHIADGRQVELIMKNDKLNLKVQMNKGAYTLYKIGVTYMIKVKKPHGRNKNLSVKIYKYLRALTFYKRFVGNERLPNSNSIDKLCDVYEYLRNSMLMKKLEIPNERSDHENSLWSLLSSRRDVYK